MSVVSAGAKNAPIQSKYKEEDVLFLKTASTSSISSLEFKNNNEFCGSGGSQPAVISPTKKRSSWWSSSQQEDTTTATNTNEQDLVASYHELNQTFLEQAQAKKLRLTPEEITAREKQNLIATPAHQHALEHHESPRKSKNMTPAFVFRLNNPHQQPLAPPAPSGTVPIPMRKHHLSPITGSPRMGGGEESEEWTTSEQEIISRSSSGIFSSPKDVVSVSSGGGGYHNNYNPDHLYSVDSGRSKDVRDDEKYISSSGEEESSSPVIGGVVAVTTNTNIDGHNLETAGPTIEKLTREFCRRHSPPSPVEQRDRQASSSSSNSLSLVQQDQDASQPSKEQQSKSSKKSNQPEEHQRQKKQKKNRNNKSKKKQQQVTEEEEEVQILPLKDDNESKNREDDKEGMEMKTKKKSRKKSKERYKKKHNNNNKEEEYFQRYIKELEYDRDLLMAEWKSEYQRAADYNNNNNDDEEMGRNSTTKSGIDFCCQKCIDPCIQSIIRFLSFAEVFFGNMPITIAAVGLSWVTQGTIWFKFMEENIDACTTVRYNSDRCTFGEFPGCFQCNTSNPVYLLALTFHYFCHSVAFTCCFLFIMKIFVAGRVVVDELSNPATSSPMGIVCITLECIFAGIFGKVGETVVIGVSVFHVLLSIWFCYMAIFKFRLLPDPSWYPNCIGLAYAAVKSWLYYPWVGKFFMSVCMFYFFTMFFIGTIRVATNHKIAAPVCFIGLSAPSITMYAMTILAQPSRHREEVIEADSSLMKHFELIHHDLYIPVMNFMMFFSLMGMASALHSLWQRWPTFKHKEFSPAHFAFIFPILSHTNAVQAYRSGVDSFAGIPVGAPVKLLLFNYWFLCLISGTIANFIFSWKYLMRLRKWTKIDISAEEERPPSPSHTVAHDCLYESDAHESILSQHFVSPAVLQANEAGQLVRLRRGTEDYNRYGPYIRTRRNIDALGFDLPMTDAELRQERAELLHWVAVNAPRTRNRTLSHNGAFQSLLPSVIRGNDGSRQQEPYGSLPANNSDAPSGGRHSRSYTHHF